MDIRNFSKPKFSGEVKEQGNVFSKTTLTPDVNNKNDVDAGMDTLNDAEFKNINSVDKEVIDGYLRYLEENKVSKDNIFEILDTLITDGVVYWSFKLFDRIDCVFRVRPLWVTEELLKYMEKDIPTLYSTYNFMVAKYNLAGSLVKYGNREFKITTPDELKETIAFVENLPFIIQNKLIEELVLFDRVMLVATSDWAIENFTKPQ